MQAEMVVYHVCLLAGYGGIMEFDADLEFTPARFADDERLAWNCFDVCGRQISLCIPLLEWEGKVL